MKNYFVTFYDGSKSLSPSTSESVHVKHQMIFPAGSVGEAIATIERCFPRAYDITAREA